MFLLRYYIYILDDAGNADDVTFDSIFLYNNVAKMFKLVYNKYYKTERRKMCYEF